MNFPFRDGKENSPFKDTATGEGKLQLKGDSHLKETPAREGKLLLNKYSHLRWEAPIKKNNSLLKRETYFMENPT